MNRHTTTAGYNAETAACIFLENSGLKSVTRNYRGRFGEIDLVMKDNSAIVFVEVRFRKSNYILDTAETIGRQKCQRLIKTALQYMQSLKKSDQYDYRFDVITINGSLENPKIRWIKNAFQA